MGRPLTIFSVALLAFFAGVTASCFTLPFRVIFAMTQSHVAALIISRELSAWHIHRNAIGSLGGQLYARANGELLRVGHVISGLEARLFVQS
jgi:hypothetical protein